MKNLVHFTIGILGLFMGTLILNFPNVFDLITPVQGLSSPSPRRRPPRIRPIRQNPTASSDLDYTNGNGGDNSKEETKIQRHEQALQDPSLLTKIRFSDRTDIHSDTRKALLEGFGLQAMTQVQARTYAAALRGDSVLARSRTGTGKTLAFLLPTIERLLDSDLDLYKPGRSIGCIILAPTRELAIQIADQAQVLFDFHNQHRQGNRKLSVACIYGGVKMQRDVRLLTGEYQGGGKGNLPTILVATPSRLLEHLEGNSPLNNNYRGSGKQNNILQQKQSKSKFADVVSETKIVVLDETDRLLQKSNQHETQKILSFMARPEKRQTLLFSATIPRAVRRLLSTSTIVNGKKKQTEESRDVNFVEVDCIGDADAQADTGTSSLDIISDDGNLETESSSVTTDRPRIEQSLVVLENMSQFIPTLLAIIRREIQKDDQNYKILVFFPAGRMVRFLYQFFTIGGILKKDSIWEIHSRMSQSSRSRASSAFRNARKGILFSSDVSARGLDYPDISLVLQMGAPSSDQDYIHRIGRTGRAGQAGKSLLVLLPFEREKRASKQQRIQKRPGKASYRNDGSIREDRQLASWINEDEDDANFDDEVSSSKSLYRKCEDDLESTRLKVRSGHVVLTPGAEAAYKTFLAHYMSTINPPTKGKKNQVRENTSKGLQPSTILAYAEDFAKGTGLAQIPELEQEFLSKVGVQ